MKNLLFAALLGSTAMIPVAASAQQAQPQGQPQQQQMQQGQPAQQGQLQEMPVGDLMDREVVSQQGEPVGRVAGVVEREGQEPFLLIEMQQDQSRVLLPLERVNMQGEQLVAQGIGQDGMIQGAQAFDEQQQAEYTEVEAEQSVQVRGQMQAQAGQQQAQRDPTGALISVDQQPAQVSVQQQPPQIIVRQAPPTIIVQQSQPEIIVRMPEPQVAVTQPEPQVQVEQAQPRVTTDQAQAMVRTEQAQPQVTFERTGEPQIQFQEEAGQPRIRIERMAEGEQQQAQQQPAQQTQAQRDSREFFGVGQEPQSTGAVGTAQQQDMAVADIEGRDVYNYEGEELGTVERIIQDPQSQQFFVVVSHGGFLGLGSEEVVMPLERMVMQGDDRLMIQGVTEEDLEAMADADRYTQYPEADGNIAISRTN